jgi:oligopeptide/dipeptide ABC transporter ATP-binding protein
MTDTILEPIPESERSRPSGPVLEVEGLNVTFATEEGEVLAVRGVDLVVDDNEVLGIVGESGSGKSVTMLAIMGLLPNTATITGSARLRGRELLTNAGKDTRGLRGNQIAMIFQDPLTALNPVHKVGDQIAEGVQAHHPDWSSKKVDERAIEMLDLVGIPQPRTRARQYPHEFSGGMRQRAMIAMAISNDPELLIADEPTTALDVTIQAQILEVLKQVQEATGTAIVFITHDLGVIARLATRVQVMYAGRTAEIADVDTIFSQSRHPYTRGLLGSLPKLDEGEHELLRPIPGAPPSMLLPPPGCAFHPRCPMAQPNCAVDEPDLRLVGVDSHVAACHYAEDLERVDSPTELAEDVVERAPAKSVLADEAASALAVLEPKKRFCWLSLVAFFLGIAAPVTAFMLRDMDVTIRGGVTMLFGIPAVLTGRTALREVREGKGYVRGRIFARTGFMLAWTALVVWGFYCFFWLLANVLPEATP